MRDDFWSPSVALNSGRLFCYNVNSSPRFQNSDDDVDDGLIIKNAATVVRYTHYRNKSDCAVITSRIAAGFNL